MDNHSLHDFIVKTGLALRVITIYFPMAALNAWNCGLAHPAEIEQTPDEKTYSPLKPTPALTRRPPLSSGNILLSFVAT